MRILVDKRDFAFSCGVVMLTGFGGRAEGKRLEDIKADLKDCDGFDRKYVKNVPLYNYDTGRYKDTPYTANTQKCAFIMVSLNQRQATFWRPILLEYGYREVTKPQKNPNSSSCITIFVREKARRKRVKKEAQVSVT